MGAALVGGIFYGILVEGCAVDAAAAFLQYMGGLFLRATFWKWCGGMLVTLPEAK